MYIINKLSNLMLRKHSNQKLFSKVFYQRKETLEKIISFSVKVKMKKKKYKDLVIPPETNHIHAIKFVEDFEKYFQLQRNPDPRVFCHALMFAVDHGMCICL